MGFGSANSMKNLLMLFFKGARRSRSMVLKSLDRILNNFYFYVNGVQFTDLNNQGLPKIDVSLGGVFVIGKNFRSNNREMANPIGRFKKCSFVVGPKGKLLIGDNVGISSTAIVCHNSIHIGNHVKLGGNVVIYDTDFHSLNPNLRHEPELDKKNVQTGPVIIGDNAFIGAHSTILKGVTIGENSIIGAGSIVTKDIPKNEIWAGNPAKFIKKI